MTNAQEPKEHLTFDEMELHSDIDVHKKAQPPGNRRPPAPAGKRSGGGMLWPVLFLIALGAAGYFFYAHFTLQKQFEQLQKDIAALNAQAAATTEDLQHTKQSLEGTLTEKQTSLQTAEQNLKSLQTDLKSSQKENTDLQLKLRGLETQISDGKKALAAAKNEAASEEKARAAAEKAQKQAEAERDRLKADLAREKETAAAQIAELTGARDALQADLAAKTEAWRKTESQLRGERDDYAAQAKRYQSQFQGESEASAKILADMKRLNTERDDFASRARKAESKARDLEDRVKKLENVSTGDLVPYSEQMDAPRVTYREPLPDGIKIPRKMGKAVVHVLVNEVGGVDKAVLLPDELMDGTLSAALTRTIYKWKFTPPAVNGVRVKAWTPVLVFPE